MPIQSGASDLPESAVRAQLDSILASAVFSRSPQLRRLLSFIVEQTLAGQGPRLKEAVLAHELYDEFYGHAMTRQQWNELITASEMMATFRNVMFKRVIPNLKRIGLLSDRIKPKYAELGLLGYEHGRAAPELTAQDLIEDRA